MHDLSDEMHDCCHFHFFDMLKKMGNYLFGPGVITTLRIQSTTIDCKNWRIVKKKQLSKILF